MTRQLMPVTRYASSSDLGRAGAGIIHFLALNPRSWACRLHAPGILRDTPAGPWRGQRGEWGNGEGCWFPTPPRFP